MKLKIQKSLLAQDSKTNILRWRRLVKTPKETYQLGLIT